MKKLLIMVQACATGPYPSLMKAQQETWDSIPHPDITTVYYFGIPEFKTPSINFWSENPELESAELVLPASDEYEMMHWKFKEAMDFVWDWDWDFMFRTNASTFVRKERILHYIQDCPTEGYYSGVIGGGYASGTNALMSRDCVDIARKNFKPDPTPAEDAYLGVILERAGIKPVDGVSRLNYNFAEYKILDADCYRCKSEVQDGNGQLDRTYDVKAFNELMKFHYK